MNKSRVNVSRREFLIRTGAIGAGFSLGLYLPLTTRGVFAAEDTTAKSASAVKEIDAWVVIEPDDTVVIRIARSEMGQGTLTGLAQLVAEELECDWSKVTTEYPTPGQNLARDKVWGSFSTGGSWGIRGSQDYVRKGGAVARHMLIEAAANQWKVPVTECVAANSVITHVPSGRTTSYGKVAAAAAELFPPEQVELKDPKDWKLIGKPVKRLDTDDKLNGKQVFAADLKLPGMLNAAIKACPVFGGKLKSFDAKKIHAMPGVHKVLRVGDDAVAVVADTWWQAKSALDALPIVWDKGPNAKLSSAAIDKLLEQGLSSDKHVFVGNKHGDVTQALKTAAKTVTASYGYPYQNHATMEPMNATARWTPDRCEVWCPTQNGEAALEVAAAASGLAITQCDVYKINLGGGFGRRGAFHDYVAQVVGIAKQMPGTPIKLLWTREEDMTHGHYHPITKCKLVGSLDKAGNLTGLHVRISGQSILAALNPAVEKTGDTITFQGFLPDGDHEISYSVPNLLVEHAMRNPPVPPGFWRGVNINQNTIYMECFLDELAHAAGKDPLEFRRRLMAKHPKSLAVLNAVADKAGWGKPAAAGVYRGLAVVKTFASHVAACAEVSVDDQGQLTIHRIVAATDPGYAVNPQQIEAQVEGSFVFGLSALLYGECTLKGGAVQQTNFHDYPSLLIDKMPKVEVIIMPSGGFWGGIGEPTISVAAPAVLNAIFAATGKRIRQFPLTHADLRRA
jgi:isoquinoline 1-oxidoreductase beta subunit